MQVVFQYNALVVLTVYILVKSYVYIHTHTTLINMKNIVLVLPGYYTLSHLSSGAFQVAR